MSRRVRVIRAGSMASGGERPVANSISPRGATSSGNWHTDGFLNNNSSCPGPESMLCPSPVSKYFSQNIVDPTTIPFERWGNRGPDKQTVAACLHAVLPLYHTANPSLKQLHQLPDPNAVRKNGPCGGISRSLGPPRVQLHTDGFCLSTLKSWHKHARLWWDPNFQTVGWLGLLHPQVPSMPHKPDSQSQNLFP